MAIIRIKGTILNPSLAAYCMQTLFEPPVQVTHESSHFSQVLSLLRYSPSSQEVQSEFSFPEHVLHEMSH